MVVFVLLFVVVVEFTDRMSAPPSAAAALPLLRRPRSVQIWLRFVIREPQLLSSGFEVVEWSPAQLSAAFGDSAALHSSSMAMLRGAYEDFREKERYGYAGSVRLGVYSISPEDESAGALIAAASHAAVLFMPPTYELHKVADPRWLAPSFACRGECLAMCIGGMPSIKFYGRDHHHVVNSDFRAPSVDAELAPDGSQVVTLNVVRSTSLMTELSTMSENLRYLTIK